MAEQTLEQEVIERGTIEDREDLFLEISWEMDAIARKLHESVNYSEDQSHLAVRALCGRLLRLSSVLMHMSARRVTPDFMFAEAAAMVRLDTVCTQG